MRQASGSIRGDNCGKRRAPSDAQPAVLVTKTRAFANQYSYGRRRDGPQGYLPTRFGQPGGPSERPRAATSWNMTARKPSARRNRPKIGLTLERHHGPDRRRHRRRSTGDVAEIQREFLSDRAAKPRQRSGKRCGSVVAIAFARRLILVRQESDELFGQAVDVVLVVFLRMPAAMKRTFNAT